MRVNGTEFAVRASGPADGVPVVLLHGLPFGPALFDAQVAALEARHRVVAYDLRGHGGSGTGEGPFAFEDHVDDLIAVLEGHGIDRAVLLRLSMGGYVALRFAERE